MQLKVVLTVLAALLPLAATTSVGSKSCKSNEFWYEDRSCCLPNGGPSKEPPSPPKGTQCPPTSHYWDDNQSCCVPRNPPPPNCPPPQCNKGWEWYSSLHQCKPIPTPSSTPPTPKPSSKPYGGNPYGGGSPSGGSPHGGSPSGGSPYGGSPSGSNPHSGSGSNNHYNNNWKRTSHKSRAVAPCPAGLDACPVSGLTGDFECLDTTSELESCGGCATLGQGQDCTAISNAWNVGCDRGNCVVYTCSGGFKIGHDGKSCVPI